MDFSKQSIVSRHFSKRTFGGLDEFEVRDYLSVLADEIQRFKEVTHNQVKQIEEQKRTIEESRDREYIIKESIAVVQRVTEKIRKDAEEQSEVMLQNAKNKKQLILKEAKDSLQSIYDDIAGLKRLYIQFKASLTASVQAHLDLLKQDAILPSSFLESSDSISEEELNGEFPLNKEIEEKLSLSHSENSSSEENSKEDKASPPQEEITSIAKSLKSLSEDFL